MLTLTPEQAVEEIMKRIDYDFSYLKRNTSMHSIDSLPVDVVNKVEEICKEKGHRIDFITDEAAKQYDKKDQEFYKAGEDREFMVVVRNA